MEKEGLGREKFHDLLLASSTASKSTWSRLWDTKGLKHQKPLRNVLTRNIAHPNSTGETLFMARKKKSWVK